jgi:hypothetical protein
VVNERLIQFIGYEGIHRAAVDAVVSGVYPKRAKASRRSLFNLAYGGDLDCNLAAEMAR